MIILPLAIDVQNVNMCFYLYKEKLESLKEYFIKWMKRQLSHEEFPALTDVSFQVEKGELFGIVGLNGSGKSTLLKIISGIIRPTSGSIMVNGTIAPLIELGTGFDMELTARENIYLNGSVLGFSKSYIEKHFNEIVSFSEMEEFLDVPMKNYSSGMVARVGFSIATMIQPEILIVDEILAVGDFRFQEKCEARIQEMISCGTTVLIVSHSLNQIERLCNRVMWLEKGHIRMMGETLKVCEAYKNT